MKCLDGRKNNVAPVPPRALDADGIAAVRSMTALGVTQRKIAQHLGIHWRTVHNVVAGKGAYAGAEPRSEA